MTGIYLIKRPNGYTGDVNDALAYLDCEESEHPSVVIWSEDETGVIIEFIDDDGTLDHLRKAGWTVEPAPAEVKAEYDYHMQQAQKVIDDFEAATKAKESGAKNGKPGPN